MAHCRQLGGQIPDDSNGNTNRLSESLLFNSICTRPDTIVGDRVHLTALPAAARRSRDANQFCVTESEVSSISTTFRLASRFSGDSALP